MNPTPPLELKVADQPWEFEAIHRLNYQTFVEEIPQHDRNPDGRLVDRFHAENRYLIALEGRHLAAMLALRSQRPFSLDAKIPQLDQHLPPGRHPVEVRLLAVAPGHRQTRLFAALFEFAARVCREAGHDLAVISGTTRQLKLYRHLGFIPFGPLVGTAAAPYQPMYLTLESYGLTLDRSPARRRAATRSSINLLPGPVCTTPEVDAALAAPALSHRGPAFLALMADVRRRLGELAGARHVQVMPGSASLATAVVAAQLALRPATGLVLANGEFGERLATEARRARLQFDTLKLPWGEPLDLRQVDRFAARLPRGGWIWCVHHETSTGMLNPLPDLVALAARRGLRLCADCVSSLGVVPVDLSGVHLATGTSGKGLAAYPGLAFVFHDYDPVPAPEQIAGYLDLGHWSSHASVPHTHSSNLLNALAVALRAATPERMARIRANAAALRAGLRALGCALVTPDALSCPGIVTLALELPLASAAIGAELEQRGILVNFRSPHLLARNWLQVSLLGDPPADALDTLRAALQALGVGRPTVAPVLQTA
ncbi:MAG TPA: hypothetical protein PLB90_11350 [Opitutaceae bacterium]|nr:hypothetical protein [Opitutaceae bacterium]